MPQQDVTTEATPKIPNKPDEKRINYPFLLACMAGLAASVAAATYMYASAPASGPAAFALLNGASAIGAGAVGAVFAPLAFIALVVGAVALLAFVSGCTSSYRSRTQVIRPGFFEHGHVSGNSGQNHSHQSSNQGSTHHNHGSTYHGSNQHGHR